MVLYIITNTDEIYRGNPGKWVEVRDTLEKLSGDACIVLHQSQVSLSMVERIRPWAICHSGGSASYSDMQEDYPDIILRWDGPQIGFCAGHQFIARTYGSKLERMRQLLPHEPDLAGCQSKRPKQFKEWGVYPVQVLHPDPLFANCEPVIYVQEYHSFEITDLHPDFQLLASSEACRVQAFKHRQKCIYGTQFHPEVFSENYPDGKRIVSNFFDIARKEASKINLPINC